MECYRGDLSSPIEKPRRSTEFDGLLRGPLVFFERVGDVVVLDGAGDGPARFGNTQLPVNKGARGGEWMWIFWGSTFL